MLCLHNNCAFPSSNVRESNVKEEKYYAPQQRKELHKGTKSAVSLMTCIEQHASTYPSEI